MEYVYHIKTQFSNDPDTYKQVLEFISKYKSSPNNVCSTASCSHLILIPDATGQVLAKDAPDWSSTFLDFLSGTSM